MRESHATTFRNEPSRTTSIGRRFAAAAGATGLLAVLAFAAPSGAAAAEPCPNAKYRTGPSLKLPDCRAYELVTPADKTDQIVGWPVDSTSFTTVNSSSVRADGEGIAYTVATGHFATDGPMGGVGILERALRDPESGWSVESTVPTPPISYIDPLASSPRFAFFSHDLGRLFFASGTPFSEEQAVPGGVPNRHGGVSLTDGATATWVSKPTWAGALPAQNTAEASTTNWVPEGASESLDALYFTSGGTHTPLDGDVARVPRSNWAAYVWKDGVLSNAGILPNGTVSRGGSISAAMSRNRPPTVPIAADYESLRNNPVSRDGSSFLFVSPDPKHTPADATLGKPQLYMYRDGEPTLLISGAYSPGEALPTTPIDGTAGVTFAGTTGRANTNPAYAVATADHSFVAFSTFDALTEDAPTDAPTTVKTYRYRTADGSLEYLPEMDRPLSGGGNSAGKGTIVAVGPGGDILYVSATAELRLWRDGQPTQLVSAGVVNSGGGATTGATGVRFSDDGSVIYVQASGPLRGETRHLPGTNNPLRSRVHVYRYEVASDELECLSCKAGYETSWGAVFTNRADTSPLANSGIESAHIPRAITPDGSTVAFVSDIPLTEDDHNDRADVYRWKNGDLALVSTGATGAADQLFYDISEDGEDIFIATREQLVPWDRDRHYDVYDVRVGGGFDPPAESGVDCSGDECQGAAASAGADEAAASERASGAGNAVPNRVKARLSVSQSRVGRAAGLAVRVSGPGRVRVTGAGVRTVAKQFGRAGRQTVVVRLSRSAAKRLAARGRLSVRVRVQFRARSGKSVTRRATVRFKTKAGASKAPAAKAKGGRR